MGKSNFDQLLERYLTGQVTEAERIKLEAWLDERKTEGDVDLELSKEDEEKIFQRITSIHDLKKPLTRKKTRGLPLLKIAASLLIVIMASYAAWMLFSKQSLNTPFAIRPGIERLILNDGTIIWLRENSHVTYYEKQEGNTTYRYATLKGEGLFEVAKDEARPFIIESGEVKIRVVGTSFHLKANANDVALSLLTGKVTMYATTNNNSMDVVPHEKVMYLGQGQFEKVSLSEAEAEAVMDDTDYKLAFADAPMSRVIERLEQKFGVEINVDHAQIRRCRVNLDLTDRSLEKSLQLITDVLPVEFTIAGNVVRLTGSGCD